MIHTANLLFCLIAIIVAPHHDDDNCWDVEYWANRQIRELADGITSIPHVGGEYWTVIKKKTLW